MKIRQRKLTHDIWPTNQPFPLLKFLHLEVYETVPSIVLDWIPLDAAG